MRILLLEPRRATCRGTDWLSFLFSSEHFYPRLIVRRTDDQGVTANSVRRDASAYPSERAMSVFTDSGLAFGQPAAATSDQFGKAGKCRSTFEKFAALPWARCLRAAATLRHRRHDLAPRAHADLSHHRRHRTDSVTPSQSSARSCPVTFWVRQCGVNIAGRMTIVFSASAQHTHHVNIGGPGRIRTCNQTAMSGQF